MVSFCDCSPRNTAKYSKPNGGWFVSLQSNGSVWYGLQWSFSCAFLFSSVEMENFYILKRQDRVVVPHNDSAVIVVVPCALRGRQARPVGRPALKENRTRLAWLDHFLNCALHLVSSCRSSRLPFEHSLSACCTFFKMFAFAMEEFGGSHGG